MLYPAALWARRLESHRRFSRLQSSLGNAAIDWSSCPDRQWERWACRSQDLVLLPEIHRGLCRRLERPPRH